MAGGSHLPVGVRSARMGEILRCAQDDRVGGLRVDDKDFEILNVDHRTSTSIGSR
jgi:hypothetical protein